MPLSNKLRADYVEMINQSLDSIPMEKPDDFQLAIIELNKIIHSTREKKPDFDDQLKESMLSIYDYYTEVEICVESRADDAEYQEIIRDRILAKIKEFTSFDGAKKYQYVVDQKAKKEKAQRDKEIVESAESKREQHALHMQTEQEMQQIFQQAISNASRAGLFPVVVQQVFPQQTHLHFFSQQGLRYERTDAYLRSLIMNRRITITRALQLTPAERTTLTTTDIHHLVNIGRISVDRALQLTENQLVLLTGNIYKLISEGKLSVGMALSLTDQDRVLLTNPHVFNWIASSALTLERALQLSNEDLSFLTTPPLSNVVDLICRGFLKISRALHLTPDERSLLQTDTNFCNLIRLGAFTVDSALQLTFAQRIILTEPKFHTLISSQLVSVELALRLTEAERALLIKDNIKKFLKCGRLSAEQILSLSDEQRTLLTTGNIFDLIGFNVLSTERALKLTETEFSLLQKKEFCEFLKRTHEKGITIDLALKIANTAKPILTSKNALTLICAHKLSISYSLELSDTEIVSLLDDNIVSLIIAGMLQVEKAIRLNESEKNILTTGQIYKLVYGHWLSVDRILRLTFDECVQLNDTKLAHMIEKLQSPQSIFNLLNREKITVARMFQLTNEEINLLRKKNVTRFIERGDLQVDRALRLTDRELEYLGKLSNTLCDFIIGGKLSVDRALHLTDFESAHLNSSDVRFNIAHRGLSIEDALSELSGQQNELNVLHPLH